MPEIVVRDDDMIPTVDGGSRLAGFRFEKNVDLLLSGHNGPILKFDLSTKYHFPWAFDRWILNLSRNGITELTFLLNLASVSKYRIYSSFFCCDALQHVNLSRCFIELPCGFEGFKLLDTLQLSKCTISTADLECLVFISPNLVKLILTGFPVGNNLRIFSKGLKFLTVGGEISDIQIDAPNLTNLMIGCLNYTRATRSISSARMTRGINSFCQGLGGVLNTRNIGIFCCSIPYLVDSLDRSPAVLLNSCFQILNVVVLDVNLADQKESSFALSLLRNAANFHNLLLFVERSGNTTSSSLWDKDIVFKSLKIVHIFSFIASDPVLAFVKFILCSAPNLRKLTLSEDPTEPKEGNPEILKRLLKFQRASTRAEIIFG